MYVQGVDNGYDLDFNGAGVTYGDVFHQAEVEYSAHNFELADTETLFRHFQDAEKACLKLLEHRIGRDGAHERWAPALPAYDQCIKASHIFNLLDARGVISVTERQAYIGRVRTLARACAQAWLDSPQGRTDAAEKAAAHEERISAEGAAHA